MTTEQPTMNNAPKDMDFEEWVAWYLEIEDDEATDYLKSLIYSSKHEGECTGVVFPCRLCSLQSMLAEYYEYFKEQQ